MFGISQNELHTTLPSLNTDLPAYQYVLSAKYIPDSVSVEVTLGGGTILLFESLIKICPTYKSNIDYTKETEVLLHTNPGCSNYFVLRVDDDEGIIYTESQDDEGVTFERIEGANEILYELVLRVHGSTEYTRYVLFDY